MTVRECLRKRVYVCPSLVYTHVCMYNQGMRANIWIRNKNKATWEALEDKSAFVNEMIERLEKEGWKEVSPRPSMPTGNEYREAWNQSAKNFENVPQLPIDDEPTVMPVSDWGA